MRVSGLDVDTRTTLGMETIMRINGLVLGLLLTLGLAACGSADKGDGVATAGGAVTTTASAAGQVFDEEQYLKFAQCMRDNGIGVADPEGGQPPKKLIPEGVTVSKEKIDAAQEKCKEFAPSPGEQKGGSTDPQQQEQLRLMAQCMRDNGFPDFPDPTDGRLAFEEGSGIDPTDPKFKAAEQACNEFAPTGPDGKPQQPGQGGPIGQKGGN
ncbi:MAG: hypothetical protein QOI21_5338 [Actinomycetota bacterium]|nr:hypothetical protein [Actinomycetota bacterium]